MKILFGQKYYGKNIEEVPSGFLVWIIEEYEKADWSLINAAKAELAHRLKLDWTPPTDQEKQLERRLHAAEAKLTASIRERNHLLNVVMMSVQCKGNPYTIESYLHSPGLLYSTMNQIKDANEHYLNHKELI